MATETLVERGRGAASPAAATGTTAAATTNSINRDAGLADEYLSDLVYKALLERGEASKVSEIALEINNPRIPVALVRKALGDSARFVSVDRLWNLSGRYLDRSRPTERNLIEVLQAAGRPLSTAQLASELSEIYGRSSEHYFQLIARSLTNERTYSKTNRGEYGLTEWLPLTAAEDEEDIFAFNGYKAAQVAPFRKVPAQKDWSPTTYAEVTRKIVTAAKRDLPHKFVGILGWLALRGKYNAAAHYAACFADPELVWLPGRGKAGGRWITRAHAERLERLLEEQAAGLTAEASGEDAAELAAAVAADAAPTPISPVRDKAAEARTTTPTAAPAPVTAEPIAETAPAVAATEEEAVAAETTKPLSISDSDLSGLERIVSERGAAVKASELLGLQYEVLPGDPSYKSDVEKLAEQLKADDRFLYVGAGRFREPNSLPPFVYDIPDFLAYPDLQFISMDGEIMDEEISDEGFAGTLRQDVLQPLAQDVGDDEGHYTGSAYEPGTPLRLVLKSHHKEIGTFPLCQVPDNFFPTDAPVVEIIVRAPDGQSHEVIVNHDKRLLFNLFGLYELLSADSGAVFVLHPTARPWEFRFEPREETDPQVYVEPSRYQELLAMREQVEEDGNMATFDITCEILAQHLKGLDFVQALTEVNLVRRVTRRKLASILSNYFCFMQKAGTPQWRFDERKRDLGTDRAKRKYLKR